MATHKVVKVRVVRGGSQMMQYPVRYRAYEIDAYGIGPTNLAYSGGLGRGESEEACLIILPNDLADEYAADPDMEIVTTAQADALMDAWRRLQGQPSEIITDPQRIVVITAKLQAGLDLTQEDKDALDSSKPVRGIERIQPIERRFPGLF